MKDQQRKFARAVVQRFVTVAFPKSKSQLCYRWESNHACGTAVAKSLGQKMLEGIRVGKDLLGATLLEYTLETEWTKELALDLWGRTRDLCSHFDPLVTMASNILDDRNATVGCVAELQEQLDACANRLETVANTWYGALLELPLETPWKRKNYDVRRTCHENFLDVHGILEQLVNDQQSPLNNVVAVLNGALTDLDDDWDADRKSIRDCVGKVPP